MAKGVAIIMMVLGHTMAPQQIRAFVYVFHMPLFFFVAGFCFKEKYLSDFKRFSIKRIKGLYWPFLKWNLLFLLLHNFFAYSYIINPDDVYGAGDYLRRLAEMLTMRRSEMLLGGFWFLPGLLCASLAGWCVIRICRGRLKLMIAVMVSMLVVSAVGNIFITESRGGLLPTNILLYTFFFVAGHFLAKTKNRMLSRLSVRFGFDFDYTRRWCVAAAFGLLSFSMAMVLRHFFGVRGVTSLMTWDMSVFVIGSLAGIMMTLSLCTAIKGRLRRVLSYYGDNTWSLLIWHFLSFKLVSYLVICIYGLPIAELVDTPCLFSKGSSFWLAYFAVGITLPLLITVSINRVVGKIRTLV